MPDTKPPPPSDPRDDVPTRNTPVDNPNAGKVDVIEAMRNAHGEAHDVTIAQQKLAADNAAHPLPSMDESLSQKTLRQLKAALSIFHEIRGAADNLRPAVAAAALQGGKDARIAAIAAALNGLLIGIDKTDDLIQEHLDQ